MQNIIKAKNMICPICKKEVEILEEKTDGYGHPFKVLSCGHETAHEVKVSDKGKGNNGIRITKAVEEEYVVEGKLKAAEYFLNNLRGLEKTEENLARADLFLILVNLDGFLFEIIAALELFKKINKIKNNSKIGKEINKLLGDENCNSENWSWLRRIKEYRNATAHRSLLKITTEAVIAFAGQADLKKPDCDKKDASFNSKNQSLPSSSQGDPMFVYLAEDPDDSLKGYYRKEIIPYCEESLKEMKKFLQKLQSLL